jgi:hypothetical protein
MSRRFFSGRECWVYRAQALTKLCGHHPDLIDQALRGAEPDYLLYSLYSPLRETNCGPFGLEGPCGSHALALTATALIISRDPHRVDERRTVREIPFTSVITISLGEALTLGWLVVRFAGDGQPASEIVFFQSSGIEHFRELVRRWLRRLSPVSSHRRPAENGRCAFADGPACLTSQMGPLLGEIDDVLVVNASEAWSAVRTRICLSPAALIAMTDRAVTIAESERPCRQGLLVFGVNVTCVPRRLVKSTTFRMSDSHDPQIAALTMRVETDSVVRDVICHLAIPADVARNLVSQMSPDRPLTASVPC